MSLAAVVLVPSSAYSADERPLAWCLSQLVVSPAYAKDGTAYCAGMAPGPKFVLYATRDHAKSWSTVPATGITLPAGYGFRLGYFAISPAFATDRMLAVEIGGTIYYSIDAGATFTPAAGQLQRITTTTTPVTGALSGRGVIVGANPGQLTARSAIVDPMLPVPQPVVGTGGPDIAFLVAPPGSPHAAYAVGAAGTTPPTTQHTLYACDASFACATKLASFPAGQFFDQAWFAADYATSGVLFATTVDVHNRVRTYVSRDNGGRFATLPALNRFLDEAYRAERAPLVAFAPARPGSSKIFARISGGGHAAEAAKDRLFSSADNGRTWQQVAWGRALGGRGPAGTMPFSYTFKPGPGSTTPHGLLTYTGTGRLLIPGVQGMRRVVWCSADGGRSWSATCR